MVANDVECKKINAVNDQTEHIFGNQKQHYRSLKFNSFKLKVNSRGISNTNSFFCCELRLIESDTEKPVTQIFDIRVLSFSKTKDVSSIKQVFVNHHFI